MEEKMVTLAILTYSKAQILQNVLANEGIESYIHNVNLIQPMVSSGVRVRIMESDLPRALKIIESSAWLADEVVDEEVEERKKEEKEKVILVPVDFSEYSMKACEFAFNFAAQMHVKVALMHIYFSPVYMPSLQYATEGCNLPVDEEIGIKSVLDSVQEQLDKLTKVINERMESGEYPKVEYDCILREGVPEEEILHYARTKKPLMIVMGTRGKGLKEFSVIGSVTAEVIERSPVFVYAIPENAKQISFSSIHKVAFMTSFDQRDLIAFDSLITIFKDYQFEISFIHLNADEEHRKWNEIKLAGIRDYFLKQYPNLKIEIKSITEDHLLSNLDAYVKEKDIDVLCISNYKRNVFARLFNPSIAKRMVFHSETPMLIIK